MGGRVANKYWETAGAFGSTVEDWESERCGRIPRLLALLDDLTSHQAKASLLGLGSTAAADARHWEASLALTEAGLHIFAATPLLSLLPLSLSLSS